MIFVNAKGVSGAVRGTQRKYTVVQQRELYGDAGHHHRPTDDDRV